MAAPHVDELFERGRELDELAARIERAAAGQGGLIVVEGPAGIGKSRLLAAARGRAEGSMRVLTARGSELEGEFAFGVVRQLFEAELAAPDRRQALLAGAAAPAAAVFGEPDAGTGGGASFASLHGLFWLVLNLAEEGPLLLAVDDLHWCDRPSLLFFAYLARRLESQPVVLLAGLREAAAGTDAALLGELANDPAATSVRPGPLSHAAVAAFVEERLGAAPAAAFAAACHDATGGNPLLLSQLVTALRSEGVTPDAAHVGHVRDIGPRAVSRTVLLRLARLPPGARAVAQAVAVLGDGAGLPAVAGLAGVGEADLADATRRLAQAEILRPERPLAFVHPLVRDAVYHDLSPGEREVQHTRAAALLRDGGASLEQVAAQLLHTSPRGEAWVAELLWEAGRTAMRAGAVDSAVAYLRRALDDLPATAGAAALLLELGAAEALTNGPAAAEHLALAYDELDDPEARADAAGLLGRALTFTGHPEEAASMIRRVVRELPDELEDRRRGLEALECMTVYFGAGDPGLLQRLRAHRRPPEDGPGRAHARRDGRLGGGLQRRHRRRLRATGPRGARGRTPAGGRPGADRVRGHRHPDRDRPPGGGGVPPAGAGGRAPGRLAGFGRVDPPLARVRRAAARRPARRGGAAAGVGDRDAAVGARGRGGDAERLPARGGAARARPPGRGRAACSSRWAPSTPARTRPAGGSRPRVALLTAAGRARGGRRRGRCARRPLRGGARPRAALVALAEGRGARPRGAPGRGDRARARRARGHARVRSGILARPHAARPGHAGAATTACPGCARPSTCSRGRRPGSSTPRPWRRSAPALRRARQPSEAREPLRRALELAGVCGADGLVAHVRSELHAAGSRPRRDALSGVDSLTPSERRVADLAVAGRSNREIAQELYVTPKTVEVHLSNAYRKLGIRSRRELGRAFGATATP